MYEKNQTDHINLQGSENVSLTPFQFLLLRLEKVKFLRDSICQKAKFYQSGIFIRYFFHSNFLQHRQISKE